jgi:hypothetical protein
MKPDHHTRHWQSSPAPGVPGRWIVEPVARTCRTCGVTIERPPGKGGTPKYCAAHRPRNAASMSTWYRAHADAIRDYQRARNGARPLVAFVCAGCGTAARSYTAATLCHRCRPARSPS